MASAKLWSVAGVALVAAAVVTPLKDELMAIAQPDPQETYLACLSSELAKADPKASVRRMVPAYTNCAPLEVAYRSYLRDQGVSAERMNWLVSRVNEVSYARFVGSAADRQLGCFQRQLKKAGELLIS